MNKKRIHNVLFHLHTVSGIVISAVLFILFFAGAFTMFKEEIKLWEQGEVTHIEIQDIDFDRIYAELDDDYNLTGRNIVYNLMNGANSMHIYIDHSHIPDASEEDQQTHMLMLNANDYKLMSYEEAYSYAEFLFRLHFLSQVPYIGIYLAGIVSFFFLFALLTGLYIHWDKIIKNFVLFRPNLKWKTIWTDAHTVLGTIAFPFQLIFAITGAFFCLSTLVLLPAFNLYGNDYEKLMTDMRPERAHAIWDDVSNQQPKSINKFVTENHDHFENLEFVLLTVENINGTNMEYEMVGDLSDKVSFTGKGAYAADAYTLEELHELDPHYSAYTTRLQRLFGRLHFGDFGGLYMQLVYAFLSFLTCFIIISGVMLWLVARDNKKVPEGRRKFNRKVVNVYLAICLSMIPVTAIGFLGMKFLPSDYTGDRQVYIYAVYFIAWLLFSVFFIFKNNFRFTLKANVLLGGILFVIVPIINGIISNNWMWSSYSSSMEIFVVDFFCLLVGVISIFAFLYLRKPQSA